MTYQGHIENGTVVMEDGVKLPEGRKVTILLADTSAEDVSQHDEGLSLYERLKDVIGTAKGLPADASQNVDHYLYGAPKV